LLRSKLKAQCQPDVPAILFNEIGLGEAHPLRLEWIQVLLKAGQKPTQWVALNIRPQIN
jgi:hypothetical protein